MVIDVSLIEYKNKFCKNKIQFFILVLQQILLSNNNDATSNKISLQNRQPSLPQPTQPIMVN